MAALALSKELQSKLGKKSEKLTDIGRFRIRKKAIEQSRGEWKYFADDATPAQPNYTPQQLSKGTPVIELAGTVSARSGVFIKWMDADRNKCLIEIQKGIGKGMTVVSDRRCLTLQREQLSLF